MNPQKLFSTITSLIMMASLLLGCVQQPPALPPPAAEVEPATFTPIPLPTPTLPSADPEQNISPPPEFGTTEIKPDQQRLPDNLQPNKPTNCPDLESTLFQVAQSPHPLKLAEQLHLKIKDDKVQVLLILASEDISFLQNFEVELGTQVGVQVQAFVPIDQLCNLANAAEVLAIRLPAMAVPQK